MDEKAQDQGQRTVIRGNSHLSRLSTILVKPVCINAGVQMLVHHDEGVCSLSETQRRLVEKSNLKAPTPEYGRFILQRSLRTADRAEAVRRSS